MQSYYGSSPAAKRFEVTQCQRKLQLPKGIVRTWNTQILCRGCSQLQEESFRRGALVDLSDGMKITGTGSYQHRQVQCGFEPLTNPPDYYFLGPPQSPQRVATRYSLSDAAIQERFAVPRSYSAWRSAGVFCPRHTARLLLLARAWPMQEIGAWSRSAPIFARSWSCSPGRLARGKDLLTIGTSASRSSSCLLPSSRSSSPAILRMA